ncbi:DNA-binding response regulator [Deinococcus cellulosilyticus NBRC 106333 = KACC 11606]|uniref:DNA-binding response regulator n=2 Tax=Deinococcus cellulosilyticus TaxID=401558 RepID=A0A511N2X8_DEIC1|nr:DNA-binding response regulator [Deinococcus cellulosilyticus NBRC 106333 = KACC 11606]
MKHMAQTILIVEDEARLAEILEDYLKREGFQTERAKNGVQALELWRAAQPDLILLDLMLPLLDGFEVARRVRAESDLPIIMLTARDDEVDKLVGLGLGADDYVVKPYSPREVIARVKAVLRRAKGQVMAPEVYRVGALEVNLGAFEVRCEGQIMDLTTSEIKLLALLAKEPNRVRQRAELLAVTGDAAAYADERTVDAHIKNIRRKLGPYGDRIDTVRGVGYKLMVH